MKLQRLRGRKTAEKLRKHGRVWKSSTMVIRWLPGSPLNLEKPREGVFVGTAASTKLHKSAVKRNRMRRRCREALRTAIAERTKMPTMQLFLLPRSRSLTCEYDAIRQDVHSFLSQF